MSSHVQAVVLAAGLSTRSPQFKMTLLLGKRTVIEHCILAMVDFVDRIVVVTGWKEDDVRRQVQSYPQVECVHNPQFRQGMFSSVKTGLAAVHTSDVFLTPGDYPLISSGVYAAMLDTPGDIVIPTYQGRTGHPVLFRNRIAQKALQMPDDATLRDLIAAQGFSTIEVMDQGILYDVDTPEEYKHIAALFEQTHKGE